MKAGQECSLRISHPKRMQNRSTHPWTGRRLVAADINSLHRHYTTVREVEETAARLNLDPWTSEDTLAVLRVLINSGAKN